MRMLLAAVGVVVAAALPVAAQAAATETNFLVQTTGDLVELCSPAANDALATAAVHFCEGYGVGVFQTYNAIAAAGGAPRIYCLPQPSPTRTQAFAAFVQWARAHPERLSEPPTDGLIRFLSERYPCSGAH